MFICTLPTFSCLWDTWRVADIKYEIHCPNCRSRIARVRLKKDIVLDCKCGFYCHMISTMDGGGFDENFELEIATNKTPLNTFSRLGGGDESLTPKLFCPFCRIDMELRGGEQEHYFCHKCERSFYPDYA